MVILENECKELNDQEIVAKSLENVDYFACLLKRYEGKLSRYILRISSFSKEEVDDVLQEIFLKVWKNLNKFDDSLSFSSWIYRIAHNTVISEWKKTQSKDKDKKIEIDEELFKNLPSKIDLEEEFHTGDLKIKIGEILDSMPEKYREVLVLKFLEEKSYEEISDIIKKPSGTVATLIHRAKKVFFAKANQKEYFV